MRKYLFSVLTSIGIPAILKMMRIRNKEITILMFHRVSDEIDPLWSPLPVAKFESLIRKLKKNTALIPLQEIFNIKKYPAKPLVAVSFDDGYRDFYENVLPILKKYQVPAHHNICPGLIDQKLLPWTQIVNIYLQNNAGSAIELPDGQPIKIEEPVNENFFLMLCGQLYSKDVNKLTQWVKQLAMKIPAEKLDVLMSWEMIRECADSGVHIGSHSLTHQNLSRITNENKLASEITESKLRIKKETGNEPRIFAFPNGLYNTESMRMVKNTGYEIILLCDDLVSSFNNDYVENRSYIFPRINISRPQWKEEYLRSLGLHQRLKKLFKGQDVARAQQNIETAAFL